jgi:hypothetical protein
MEEVPKFEFSYNRDIIYVRYKGRKVFGFWKDICYVQPVKWYEKEWVLVVYNKSNKWISSYVFLDKIVEETSTELRRK